MSKRLQKKEELNFQSQVGVKVENNTKDIIAIANAVDAINEKTTNDIQVLASSVENVSKQVEGLTKNVDKISKTDFLTKKDLAGIKKAVTPKKGIDYDDGIDGFDFDSDLVKKELNEKLDKKLSEIEKKLEPKEINAKDIKGLQAMLPKVPPMYGGGSGATFLKSLRDVDVSGLTKNAQGKYELGSGVNNIYGTDGTLTGDRVVTVPLDNTFNITKSHVSGRTSLFGMSDDLFDISGVTGNESATIDGAGFQYKLANDEWFFVKTTDDTNVGGEPLAALGYTNTTTNNETFIEARDTELVGFSGNIDGGTGIGWKADRSNGIFSVFTETPDSPTNVIEIDEDGVRITAQDITNDTPVLSVEDSGGTGRWVLKSIGENGQLSVEHTGNYELNGALSIFNTEEVGGSQVLDAGNVFNTEGSSSGNITGTSYVGNLFTTGWNSTNTISDGPFGTDVSAIYAQVDVQGTGAPEKVSSITGSFENTDSGTVTDVTGFRAQAFADDEGGDMTNYYGFRIEDGYVSGYTGIGRGVSIEQADLNNYFAGNVTIGGRIQGAKGSDVASATDITLGDGNYFDITGTTQIDTIVATDWQAGSTVTLQFDASVTVKHATSGTGAELQLAGSTDFSATAGDTLMLVYDGTYWREISRTVI